METEHIEKFIVDARLGGWKDAVCEWHGCKAGVIHDINEFALLDPEAWKAVGKTRGWKEACSICGGGCEGGQDPTSGEWDAWCKGCGAAWLDKAEFPEHGIVIEGWLSKQHRFIDALADGKTINAALEALN